MSKNRHSMKQEIRDELKEMGSSLADTQAAMPFSVPDGYFEEFGAGAVGLVANDEVPAMPGGKKLLYEMPEGYFEKLPGRITESVTKGERKGVLITFGPL